MERIDQERMEQLLDAARRVNGDPTPDPQREAVRVGIERPGRPSATRHFGPLSLVARIVGALAVLAVGAVHLQQYETLYSAIPTIGTLFVLNFAGATAIGLGLLAPLETVLRRWRGIAAGALAVAGIALSATSFAFLTISEQTPLFGFMEPGYDPSAILASRVAEAVAVASLGAFLLVRFAMRSRGGRW